MVEHRPGWCFRYRAALMMDLAVETVSLYEQVDLPEVKPRHRASAAFGDLPDLRDAGLWLPCRRQHEVRRAGRSRMQWQLTPRRFRLFPMSGCKVTCRASSSSRRASAG